MTQYANYNYYISTYKGTMPEADFSRLSVIASMKIKANTFGRIDENNIQDEVKYCTCVLADKLLTASKSENKTSETVGPWTVHYADSKSGQELIQSTLKEFLSEVYTEDGTPLLYRGC